jgi:hypothetical protein
VGLNLDWSCQGICRSLNSQQQMPAVGTCREVLVAENVGFHVHVNPDFTSFHPVILTSTSKIYPWIALGRHFHTGHTYKLDNSQTPRCACVASPSFVVAIFIFMT